MSDAKGNTFENELLLHIFNNAAIALIGDAGGLQPSVAAGSLYVSLHTATPDEAGNQTTNETAYVIDGGSTPYARKALARTSGATGWDVSGNSVSPGANIDFDECVSSPGAALTHFAVGTTATGTGKVLYYGTLTPNITMAAGVIPRVKTTSTITEN